MKNKKGIVFFQLLGLIFLMLTTTSTPLFAQTNDIQIGVYYFGGWAGHKQGSEAWDKNAPTHVTEKLEKDFSGRKPLWGWRDDTDKIMKKQINLASKNGIDCFFFDWYWSDNKSSINEKAIFNNSLHDCISRYMRAKNNKKLKFAMMIANHGGAEIKGMNNWLALVDFMSKAYFNHPQYLKYDGKPVIAVFAPKDMFPYIDDMRLEAKKNGLPGLYIIALGNHNDLKADAFSWYNIRQAEPGTLTERQYSDYIKYVEKCWYNNPRLYPNVMAGWDQRPWDPQNKTLFYTGRTPLLFGQHLSKAYDFLQHCSLKHKLILIYAWNEMGEGGYLVPTLEDPKALFLKEIKKVKKQYSR